MDQHDTLAPVEEPRVWYRYAVREVRFMTGYTLTEEPVARRADLLKAVKQMAADLAYRELTRPDGWTAGRIEGWVRNTVWQFEEALESGDFRRFESDAIGTHAPVGIIVEDMA